MIFSKLIALLFGANIVYNNAIADVNFIIENKVNKYEPYTRNLLFIGSNNKKCFDIFKDITSDYELPYSSSLKDLETTKNQIIIWIGGLLFASGLIQHFFK